VLDRIIEYRSLIAGFACDDPSGGDRIARESRPALLAASTRDRGSAACLAPFHSKPETAMAVDSDSPSPVFTYGRIALWLVLALMVISVVYAAWHVVANWTYITV
jgi:hypothetical protein